MLCKQTLEHRAPTTSLLTFHVIFHLPFHFHRVKEGLPRKDEKGKKEDISLQQLGASPLIETI